MEHFQSPAGTKLIDIPYVGVEDYDGGKFLSYPHRKRWSEDQLMGNPNFGDRSRATVEAFFQTWLYFGSLISVFRIAGVEVKPRDFIRETEQGHKFITTKLVQSFIRDWIDREGMEDDGYSHLAVAHSRPSMDRSAKNHRGSEIEEILRRVGFFVARYCDNNAQEKAKAPTAEPPFWPMSSEIALSIMAINWTLSKCAASIYGYSDKDPTCASSSLLNRRFKEAGWCPWERYNLDATTLDIAYYYGSFPSPRKQLDHSDCTELACYARNVDVAKYRTLHITNGCLCPIIEAPHKVTDIVKGGKIPIIMWRQGKFIVSEYDDRIKTKFVAISHVWSDGMGNPNQNALPVCQLSRLQSMVDRLYTERHNYRQDPPLPPRETDSINSLEETGTEPCWSSTDEDSNDGEALNDSTGTEVGFWMDTLCVPVPVDEKHTEYRTAAIRKMASIYRSAQRVLVLDSMIQSIPRSADVTEKSVRIYLSNWNRRLWTLQEALLGRTLVFQFQDGPQTIGDMHGDLEAEAESVARLYSSVRASASDDFDKFYYYMRDMIRKASVGRFDAYADAISRRTTTKLADEPICFATILGIDVGPLLDCADETRMERFYEMVGIFNHAIIFNDFPRLQKSGYKWAPRSLIAQSRTLSPNSNISGRSPAEEYARLNLGGGLDVMFPGLKLDKARVHLGNNFFVVPRKNPPFLRGLRKDTPRWCRVSLQPDTEGRYPTWEPASRYVIVMCNRLRKDGQEAEAILAIYRSTHADCMTITHVSRARVVVLAEKELPAGIKERAKPFLKGDKEFAGGEDGFDGQYPVGGKWLDCNQEWCIY